MFVSKLPTKLQQKNKIIVLWIEKKVVILQSLNCVWQLGYEMLIKTLKING